MAGGKEGTVKSGVDRGRVKGGSKSVSRSEKAGLQFPVSRIARYLKKGRYSQRVGSGSCVYLSAVLEHLAAEVEQQQPCRYHQQHMHEAGINHYHSKQVVAHSLMG